VIFPLHAYRDRSAVLPVTRTPARDEVLPFHRSCHSSELCLEWEVRLGSEHPFRKAQTALNYFTHGALDLEDTTIARHMVKVGQVIERDWTYRPPEEIRRILSDRATQCRKSGQPIVYISTDAHALRRYVDETWDAQWKMANGVRLWCLDRHNGATIPLGGEYTWGDCGEVADIFRWLAESKRLPSDGSSTMCCRCSWGPCRSSTPITPWSTSVSTPRSASAAVRRPRRPGMIRLSA